MKQIAARIHNGLAWLIFLGSHLAFFLIGLSVFGAAAPTVHGTFGRILWLTALLMFLVSLVCRHSWRNVGFSFLVFLLLFLQGVFVYMPAFPGVVRAFHALNGLAIMWLAYGLARGRVRATAMREQVAITSYQ